MRKRLVRVLTSVVLGFVAAPAWAQLPAGQPLPDPTPLGAPTESPPPPTVTTVLPSNGPGYAPGVIDGDPCCQNKRGTWSIGGGLYYITPVFESNPAYIATTILGGTTSFDRQDFSHDMNIAPLAWVSYTCANGVGIRGRWWMFDDDGKASALLGGATAISDAGGFFTVTPGAGSTVAAASSLHLHVYDLEATYQWNCGCWSFLASAGARYVQLSQSYQLSVVDGGGVLTDSAFGTSSFNGGGGTFSIEFHRPVCSSCFSAYGNLRGSLLFGTGVQTGGATGTAGSASASARQMDVLPIGEAEVGGEWGRAWGRCRLFAQVGVVGQVWWGGGNAVQGPAGGDLGQNFGFFGGVARFGINF